MAHAKQEETVRTGTEETPRRRSRRQALVLAGAAGGAAAAALLGRATGARAEDDVPVCESKTSEQPVICGQNSGTGPGVRGISYSLEGGHGVEGVAGSDQGVGVLALGGKNGLVAICYKKDAVYAHSVDGKGVDADSIYGDGIRGASNYNVGVGGIGGAAGVRGRSKKGTGVSGISAEGEGVKGESTTGTGVSGISAEGEGVKGKSTSGYGVEGTSDTGVGVFGSATTGAGVLGLGAEQGVKGISPYGSGVQGEGQGKRTIGVLGKAAHEDSTGVMAYASGPGTRALSADGRSAALALDVLGKARFSTAGEGFVPAVRRQAEGETSSREAGSIVDVANPAVTAHSHITVTFTAEPGGLGIAWVERQPASGFVLHLVGRSSKDVPFTYLIVEPSLVRPGEE